MTPDSAQCLIEAHYSGKLKTPIFTPKKYTLKDCINHSWLKNKRRWTRNKRLKAKFEKRPSVYITDAFWAELIAHSWAVSRINYEEIAKKVFPVQRLPEGALPIYDKI